MTEEQLDELLSYRKYVRSLAKACDGKIILNRSPEHAAVIVEHLFLCSESEANILTAELHPSAYGSDEVISAAIKFVHDHPAAKITILSEKAIPPTHPLLEALSGAGFIDRVEIVRVPDSLQKDYKYNFFVGDGHHFRFEKDRGYFDAVVQFGAPAIGSKLKSVFSKLKKNAQKVAS
jgi:hypothetical protein